eukprot:CAMPEP_0182426468 /NCGR_PEP_ID=MMETSP1167-20130531/12965_1 /TAXON_ID=2988 /ORGANISM="Mallomonas Sp, Strain CCMP3275" /LENGTH=197 /DNA_ID=CAMNT_0024607919 /DNA_START=510 /DNA_END=1103 /DNA_ORIENTATION=-
MTLVMTVGFMVAMIGVSHILFFHKTLLAIEGADVDANFNIVRDDDSSRKSSGLASNVLRKLRSRTTHASQGMRSVHSSEASSTVSKLTPVSCKSNILHSPLKSHSSVTVMKSLYEVKSDDEDDFPKEHTADHVFHTPPKPLVAKPSFKIASHSQNPSDSASFKKTDESRSDVESFTYNSFGDELEHGHDTEQRNNEG